ncbi:MAG: M28 family peptidase, partial [Myxococcales bacterium]
MRNLTLLLLTACAASQPAAPRPDEPHLADLRRLTRGGQNAEAYWSFDGTKLSLQSRAKGEMCDRIYTLDLASGAMDQVSSGKGATTCSHFLPGGEELIYASTHLGGDACPPRPDMSQGYVWALYKDYDIFKRTASGLVRLTDTPGYDAEGTVCARDGSIVFTSVRDGDLELYRMDRDGKNVKRLTDAPGYDGGAFFSADCSKIVWRASRPKGAELEEYQRLLAQGLVKPGKLEIWVANADGTDGHQVTYLDAASFAPFFFPDGRRIIFSSNFGDPQGREFDLWAVNVDGTQLERITTAPGFDGFPMFSPDGKWLAFSSNRAFPPGAHETDVYVARWVDAPPAAGERPADRILRDVKWLAAPEREGRGVGTKGLEAAGAYIEQRFREIGLEVSRQPFEVPVSVSAQAAVTIDGAPAAPEAFAVPGYSASATVEAPLTLAGYGVVEEDFAKAKDRVVLVRRFVPDDPKYASTEAQRRFGDIRHKAWLAKERGAKALLVVDWPEAKELPQEARLPAAYPEAGDAGIPVVVVKRAVVEQAMGKLAAGKPVTARLQVTLTVGRAGAFNVVGRLRGNGALPGVVVIGAHYDHLGLGGRFSLAPEKSEPHLGADDNASGVAGVLEVARSLAARRKELRRDLLFVAFSGEEEGILGSTHFAREVHDVAGMLNLDMVGRLRGNRLSVLGSESAAEWTGIASGICAAERVDCTLSGDGYGPSDQTPFYAAGVPVLFFFTGAHSDYHKPSDDPSRINAAGAAQVAHVVADVALAVDEREQKLTYRSVPAPPPDGDVRSFGASMGTIPDYSGPPNGQKGMLLSGVRTGGAA